MENTIQNKLDQAFKTFGNRMAIEYGNRKMTYDELNKASDSIREMLICQECIKESHVGIFVEDKMKLISAILGILKTKCVFVPLDPLYPDKRLEYMTQSSDIRFVITEHKNYNRIATICKNNTDIKVLDIEDFNNSEKTGYEVPEDSSPYDPIYLFFTSGSTGKPKAILGKNESLLHFVNWENKILGINENTKVSQLTSPSFDAILRDIFVPLCSGGIICIPESREVILDKTRFIQWIEESEVQIIHCTPSLFGLINSEYLTPINFPKLKYILMAGEKINPLELEHWYDIMDERIQLVNLYGATETTMVKMFYFIKREDCERKTIPIGIPMTQTQIYIMDENLCPCSEWEAGEIYISTPFMTLGYYHNQTINDGKFIKYHFSDDEQGIIYKTGDLGRMLTDGNIEFLGRIDRQVKIRGNRVELSEIEREMLTYPEVNKCIVDLRNGSKKLEADDIKYCKRCGLTSAYPNTTFDENNICNYCNDYEEFKSKSDAYFRPMSELKEKLCNDKTEKKGEYDCLLLYSGGKDSTYVLYKLMEMGIRVLAYTFDNGYISETALKNINSIVKEFNIDHITGTYKDMPKVFVDGLKEECSVCNGCFKVLRILSTRLAYEKGIKYIVTGLSRGQIFDVRLYDILNQGAQTVEEMENKVFEQRLIYHSKEDYTLKLFDKEERIKKEELKQVELIDFYRYCDISKTEIISYLKEKSAFWNNPKDTGFCSSNCLINDTGIYLQRKYKKYDNYTFPNSWEVRIGHLSLEDSRRELESDVDYSRVKKIFKELQYNDNLKGRSKEDSLVAYYLSDRELEGDELRSHLQQNLPDYMIPTHFIRIDSVPVTPNGKIDYNVLPDPTTSPRKVYVAPRDEVEIKLSEIWSEILGREDISIRDNFLEIGVHSLNIMTMIAKVYEYFEVELPLEEVFNQGTIENIAAFIRQHEGSSLMDIQVTQSEKYYPLSFVQRRVFTNEQIADTGTGYNISAVFTISGKLDIRRMEEAFDKLIQRHESLRTSFQVIEGAPVQIIQDKTDFKLSTIDLNGRDPDEVIRNCIKPFDLSKAPLIRAFLIKVSEEKHLLVLDVHHIVADGKSLLILQHDLASLYGGNTLPEIKIQYKDFTQWHNQFLESENLKQQENFWLATFSDFKPKKSMPTDFPRRNKRSFAGDSVEWEIDTDLSEKLYEIAAKNKTTLFMLLLAGFNVLYSKYTASQDITIGSPIEGRKYTGLKNMVGMFVNTLAIRSYPSREKSFREYLQEIKSITLKSYENQDYQFDMLVKKLKLQGYGADNPIFDTVFSMLNYEDHSVKIENLDFEYYEKKTAVELYDIRCEIIESPKGFRGSFKYSAELFKRETIERLSGDYIKILEIIAYNQDIKLKDIQIRQQVQETEKDVFSGVDFDF